MPETNGTAYSSEIFKAICINGDEKTKQNAVIAIP
jgi:hypothetical protein